MCKGLNVSLDFAVNAADCVFKRMQLPRDHREKQQHGMLKQNGNERFYQFFFSSCVTEAHTTNWERNELPQGYHP